MAGDAVDLLDELDGIAVEVEAPASAATIQAEDVAQASGDHVAKLAGRSMFALSREQRALPETLGGMRLPGVSEMEAVSAENALLLMEWQWLQAEFDAKATDLDAAQAIATVTERLSENLTDLTRLYDQMGVPIATGTWAGAGGVLLPQVDGADLTRRLAALAADDRCTPAMRALATAAQERQARLEERRRLEREREEQKRKLEEQQRQKEAAERLKQQQQQKEQQDARWPASNAVLTARVPEPSAPVTSTAEPQQLQNLLFNLIYERFAFNCSSAASAVAQRVHARDAQHVLAVLTAQPSEASPEAVRMVQQQVREAVVHQARLAVRDIQSTPVFLRHRAVAAFLDLRARRNPISQTPAAVLADETLPSRLHSACYSHCVQMLKVLRAAGDTQGAAVYETAAHVLSRLQGVDKLLRDVASAVVLAPAQGVRMPTAAEAAAGSLPSGVLEVAGGWGAFVAKPTS